MKIPWSAAVPGDIVKGNDGHAWEVHARAADGTLTISREGRAPFSGKPTGDVEIVARAKDLAEAAVAVAQVKLGGTVVAQRADDGRYRCPPAYSEMGTLAAHLYVFHGVSAKDLDFASATARHQSLHEGADVVAAPQDHIHDPEFWKR